MTRIVNVAAAQLGPIPRSETRAQVVERLIAHLREGHRRGCDLVVFPELALTTFFPRWWIEDEAELTSFYEREMPGVETEPLFDEALRLGVGFCLGYAELAMEDGVAHRYNTAILVEKDGRIVGKYRKIHLPGHREHEPWREFQHLEKRYFEPGNLGFRVFDAFGAKVGMLICNDRRWPEAWRVLGLQGCELGLVGYNTPIHHPPTPDHNRLVWKHNELSLQAGAYQNAMWIAGVAKGGTEEGVWSLGDSQIVGPTGETATRVTGEGDELVSYACDLDVCAGYREWIFNFARHREPEWYGLITATKGALTPAEGEALERRLRTGEG